MNKCFICKAETEIKDIPSGASGGGMLKHSSMTKIEGYCNNCKDRELEWKAEMYSKEGDLTDTIEIKATPEAALAICKGQSKYWKLTRIEREEDYE